MICHLCISLEFELDGKKFPNSQREVLFMIFVGVVIWMPSEYYPKMSNFATVQGVFFLNSASSSLSLRFHVVVLFLVWSRQARD